MSKFKDDKGREWTLVLNYHIASRIEDELEIPLLSKLQEVEFSPRHCVEMVWMIIEQQAEKQGVTPEDFGGSIIGDTLEHLSDALLDCVAFFYKGLNPQQAKLLTSMKEMRKKLTGELLDRMEDSISEVPFLELLDSLASTLEDSQRGNSQKWSEDESQIGKQYQKVEEMSQILRAFLSPQETSKS